MRIKEINKEIMLYTKKKNAKTCEISVDKPVEKEYDLV
jgi:hypothetical protein